MAKFCEKCGAELLDEVKFCDKCGAEVRVKSYNPNNNASNIPIQIQEKNMGVALLISFFLNGLGMAYAGNVGKGVGFFVGSIIINIFLYLMNIGILRSIILIIILIIGLFLTYQEVDAYNQRQRLLIKSMINN